jgi:hypothetical protein
MDVMGPLKDVALALAVVLLFPLVILIVGAPVALLARLLIEIAGRM